MAWRDQLDLFASRFPRYRRYVPESCFAVVELRRYVTHPGKRDTLISLFESEFLESQEACGMSPFGHYSDLDDPNSFVWLRGFARMEMRRAALDAFYTSPAWLEHREAANATMIDSDNVLLLRNARPNSGFDTHGLTRPGGNDGQSSAGARVAVSIFMLDGPAAAALVGAFEETVLPELRRDADRVASLVTEERPNDFPRLPVREGEFAFVVAGICRSDAALEMWCHDLDAGRLPAAIRSQVTSVETLRLAPAPRALFR